MSKSKVFVLVGDSACGKSSLACMFATGTFSVNHFETEFEDFNAELEGTYGVVQLRIYDTSGDAQDRELRNLCYGESDAVLICFDLTDPASLANVEKKWIPEVTKQCPGKPFFLIGCKKDLLRTMRKFSIEATTMFTPMGDDSSGFVSEDEESCGIDRLSSPRLNHADIWTLQLDSGAMGYFECSARTSENVSNIFSRMVDVLDCEWKKQGRSTWPRKNKLASSSVYKTSASEIRPHSKSVAYLDLMKIKKGFTRKLKKLRRSLSSTPKVAEW